MRVRGLIVGAVFGMTAAVLCSFIFGIVVSIPFFMAVTSLLFVEIFLQAIVPFLAVFSLAGAQFQRIDRATQSGKWIISIIMAFFVAAYAGTIGSLITHIIVWDAHLENLAVGNIIVWGFLYSVLLLPLAAPISKWLLQMLLQCCNYFDDSKLGRV